MTGAPRLDQLAPAILDEQRIGLVVQHADGSILDFNAAALDALAMTADQLRGVTSLDPRWEAVDVDGQPLDGSEHPAMRALKWGDNQLGITMGVRAGDGTMKWLVVDSFLLDGDTDSRIVASTFLDMTAEIEARARTAEALDRLQRHVLPQVDPEVGWLRVAHRYVNVSPPLDVGGDFLDVFRLDDGRCAFFIGDVCGHDLDAVATMVIARHTLRAAGLHLNRPSRVLRWLHDTLMATPDTVYCSAVFGTLTPDTDGTITARWANAGHPTPIVLRPDGPHTRDEHGTIIGVIPSWSEPPTVEVTLQPGDELVMYTDGLLDNPRPRLTEAQLFDALRGAGAGGAIDVIDAILDTATAGGLGDDTAALVITAVTPDGS